MRRAMRSGRPAASRMTPSELSIESGQLSHDCNYIARRDLAGVHHAQIEPAHAPARRSVVERFHALVVNLLFDGGPVDIERRAGSARLGNFEQRPAGANAVADAQVAYVDAASGQVLAQGAEGNGVTAPLQLFHHLGGDQ